MKGLVAAAVFASLFAIVSLAPVALAAQTVGEPTLVIKTVTGKLSNGTRRLRLQDDIYHNEVIETFEENATEVTLLDETVIAMGPNSRITLDRFVYAPNLENSTFVMTLTKGVMRFTSGNLPSQAYVIHTPIATIGIRGTIIEVIVTPTSAADGSSTANVSVTVVEGEAEIINCDRVRTSIPTGLSSTVYGLNQGGCSEATIPGPPAEDTTKLFEETDRIILRTSNDQSEQTRVPNSQDLQ